MATITGDIYHWQISSWGVTCYIYVVNVLWLLLQGLTLNFALLPGENSGKGAEVETCPLGKCQNSWSHIVRMLHNAGNLI